MQLKPKWHVNHNSSGLKWVVYEWSGSCNDYANANLVKRFHAVHSQQFYKIALSHACACPVDIANVENKSVSGQSEILLRYVLEK